MNIHFISPNSGHIFSVCLRLFSQINCVEFEKCPVYEQMVKWGHACLHRRVFCGFPLLPENSENSESRYDKYGESLSEQFTPSVGCIQNVYVIAALVFLQHSHQLVLPGGGHHLGRDIKFKEHFSLLVVSVPPDIHRSFSHRFTPSFMLLWQPAHRTPRQPVTLMPPHGWVEKNPNSTN